MFSNLIFKESTAESRERSFYNFIGVGIEAITYKEMESLVNKWIGDKTSRSHHIACINAYCVSLSFINSRLRKIYNSSDIAGPDGMPFVRWVRWVTKIPCDRFAAPDIALYLAERSVETNYTFYLYGGAPDVLVKMQDYLQNRFPHINIVGAHSPPFRTLSEEEDQAICDEINSLKPDIVLVGLGTPKQDYWIDEHLDKLKGAVIVASGATFDFFGGRIKMAPHWVRNSGFEWLYRLMSKDFLRLWKRYTYYNLLFVARFSFQITGLKEYQLKRFFRENSQLQRFNSD